MLTSFPHRLFKIGFFGSDRFSRICLERLLVLNHQQSRIDTSILKVFCPPDLKGELLLFAQQKGLKYELLPPKTLKNWHLEEEFDVGLTASIGYFIKPHIMDKFVMGMLNAHPSILPCYRGAAPLAYTIMNGDAESGVSIIDLDSTEFDAGNIWLQEKVKINPYSDYRLLEEQMGRLSGELFYKIFSQYEHFQKTKQSQSGFISFAPKPVRDLVLISFTSMTCLEIYGRFQALKYRFFPSAMVLVRNANRAVTFMDIVDPRTTFPKMETNQFAQYSKESSIGAIFYEKATGTMWIKALDGWLGVRRFRFANHPVVYDAGNFVQVAQLTQPFSIPYFT